MSDKRQPSIVLTGIHATAYWLSSKPKQLDRDFEHGLLVDGQDPASPIPYLGGPVKLPRGILPRRLATNLSLAEARRICKKVGGWPPVHIITGASTNCIGSLGCIKRHLPEAVSRHAFIRIDDHLLVPTPELTLLQAAPLLDEIELTVLCSLFFGIFCFGPSGSNAILPRRALCTVASVKGFIQQCRENGKAPDGAKQLESACKNAIAQTASPAELNCGLRMELPAKLGGYGFDGAVHNARVSTTDAFSGGGQRSRWCDWLWEMPSGKRVAVEYESDEDHSGEARRKRDRKRDNELAAVGITPFSLFGEHLMNTAKMDEAAFQIARELGATPPSAEREAFLQRDELRRQIAAALDRFKGLMA